MIVVPGQRLVAEEFVEKVLRGSILLLRSAVIAARALAETRAGYFVLITLTVFLRAPTFLARTSFLPLFDFKPIGLSGVEGFGVSLQDEFDCLCSLCFIFFRVFALFAIAGRAVESSCKAFAVEFETVSVLTAAVLALLGIGFLVEFMNELSEGA